jgi:hypothetical protein
MLADRRRKNKWKALMKKMKKETRMMKMKIMKGNNNEMLLRIEKALSHYNDFSESSQGICLFQNKS